MRDLFIEYRATLLTVYFISLWLCLLLYTTRNIRDYNLDFKERQEYEADMKYNTYTPRLTWGTIIGRYILCFTPVANTYCSVFYHVPFIWIFLDNKLGKIFKQPLVPKRPKE